MCSPPSTLSRGTTRWRCSRMTSPRLPSSRPSASSSSGRFLHQFWFWSPCHSDFGPRLPVYVAVMVHLLSLPWHRAHHDHRLPPSVQWDGGADELAVEGGIGSPLLCYILALRAAMGPPRPQECPFGGFWHVFRRASLWHTTVTAWSVLVDARASRQPPQYHGSLRSASSGPSFFTSSGPVHLLPLLWEAECIFVRRDGLQPLLTPLYDNSYKVDHCSSMFFRLAFGDCEDSVSVSRLKPW